MVKNVLTSFEVAQCCHVTMTTVANWIKDGSLKAFKTKGGHRRIRREDLELFARQYNMPLDITPRILIVDDDMSVQTGLRQLFESHAFVVDSAHNGFEAGVIVQKRRPDVIVLSILMSEFDGFEVIEYIKKHTDLKDIKIIVLTGHAALENTKKAKQAGADICIEKPVDSNTILKMVEKAIGHSYVLT